MLRPALIRWALLLAGALALTLARVPPASSQGLTVVASFNEGELPTEDPDSPRWAETTAVDVPLSAQVVARPILRQIGVRALTVRALHNGRELALLLEWDDATEDSQSIRVQDFRDAVAVQFPLVEEQPFFCMGQPGGGVNIWHWKADWQADLDGRQDMDSAYPDMHVDEYPFAPVDDPVRVRPADYDDPNYLPALAAGNPFALDPRPSSVEDLTAGGFGTLASQPLEAQNVFGHGLWSEGRWRVILRRALQSSDPDDARLSPGTLVPVAFAAWDGANGERDGQKSTSDWITLQIAPGQPAAPASRAAPPNEGFWFVVFPPLAMLALLLLMAGGLTVGSRLLERWPRR